MAPPESFQPVRDAFSADVANKPVITLRGGDCLDDIASCQPAMNLGDFLVSLDVFVWLPCSVDLALDLPRQAEWRHFERHESWLIDRDGYSISVSRIDRAADLGQATSQPEATTTVKSEAELAERVKKSKMGLSLILEGRYEAGYLEQNAIVEHLARKCGGAIVEGPGGYQQVDERGDWK